MSKNIFSKNTFLVFLLLFLTSHDTSAQRQEGSSKEPVHVGPILDKVTRSIPSLKEGFVEKCHGRFCFRYPRELTERAKMLAERIPWLEAKALALLGGTLPPTTTVALSTTKQQFLHLLPSRARIPNWAAAVAFSRLYYIVMGPSKTAPISSRFVLLAHEYSHVALAHTTNFRSLPKWFVEGFADLMAGRLGLPVVSFGSPQLSMKELESGFPRSHKKASAAYSQSRAFVSFLYSNGSPEDFRNLIERLRRGKSLHVAVEDIYGVSLDSLEKDWRKNWRYRKFVIPLVTSGLLLWIVAALLLVFGYIKKKRARAKKLKKMEDETSGLETISFSEEPLSEKLPLHGYRPPLFWILTGLGMTFLATGLIRTIFPDTRVYFLFGITGIVIGSFMAVLWWKKSSNPVQESESTDDLQ